MIKVRNTFLLASLLFISACGYHLRGSIDLPEGLKSIFLKGATSQLHKTLKQTLRASDGQLVDDIQQAGIVVDVVYERMDRRVLSLSSTGRANEYELTYVLYFMLLDADGGSLSEKQKVEIRRDYFNDQEEILGKNNEELIIREEMYRQAVQSMIRRSRIALEKYEKQ